MHSAINADQLLRDVALAVARNQVGASRPIHEIIASEGLTQSEYNLIAANPQFQRYVDAYATELTENGFSIKAKARLLTESLLPDMYHLVRDPDQPAAARVKMFENFASLADAVPKKEAAIATANTQFGIVINIPSEGMRLVAQGNTQHLVQEAPISIELPVATPKAPSSIVFDEPDSFEYAGDDIYL